RHRMVGALSTERRGDRQLERGDGDRADRDAAAAAALAQCGQRGNRALRLGRVRDRVLPDLRFHPGARAARAPVARGPAARLRTRAAQPLTFKAVTLNRRLIMPFSNVLGARFRTQLSASALVVGLCAAAANGPAMAAEKITYLLPAPPSLP